VNAKRPHRVDPRLGATFAGLRVERLLGRGGMGAAYLARGAAERPVVLKFMNKLPARDPKLRRRFQREWAALAKIGQHPNLVGVLGIHEEEEVPFIALEFVPGRSLQQRLREGGPLPALEAGRAMRDVARGLAAMHAQRILHRDIKPENIILTPEGSARIIDFGLAKDAMRSNLTQPGQMLGTAAYMAPEQWDDELPCGPGADLFALGATLYHLLLGRPPFEGQDVYELLERIEAGDYRLPRSERKELPLELERIIIQLLDAEPRFRYRDAGQVAADLEEVFRGGLASAPCLLAPGVRLPLLPGEVFTLGSDPSCELRLEHPSLAPRHAQLRRGPAGWSLRDLKSPSGTFLQGQPVRFKPLELGPRARLRCGALELEFHDPRHPGAAG
jgi:serine/threonine protein kinase